MFKKDLFDLIPPPDYLEKNKDCAEILYNKLSEILPIYWWLCELAENSQNGFYLCDGDGKVLYINRAYEKFTGFSRETLVGENVRILLEQRKILQSSVIETIKRKKTMTVDSFFGITNRMITIVTTPILDENGKVLLVIGNMTDITELVYIKETFYSINNPKNNAISAKSAVERTLKRSNSNIVVNDFNMLKILYFASKVALSDATILITGETGTGKEELVKFIHANSLRNNAPMVQINCGAIPENLIESELFGYVGGAFTGAKSQGKPGLFEEANEGTMFLDEIGELPLQTQSKLLRVLQEQKLQRIGSLTSININVRIIAATNCDLQQMVREKKFRDDLYYRLNVVPIFVPPLRERKSDIIPLSIKFLQDACIKYEKKLSFSPEALDALRNYYWPGNIRELKNLIERAAIVCDEYFITDQLLFETAQSEPNTIAVSTDNIDLKAVMEKIEWGYIKQYYNRYKSVRSTAKALGMDRSTFNRKLSAYLKKFGQ